MGMCSKCYEKNRLLLVLVLSSGNNHMEKFVLLNLNCGYVFQSMSKPNGSLFRADIDSTLSVDLFCVGTGT